MEMDTRAVRDVIADRLRLVSGEGWTPEHDDEHREGEMARAAAAYAYFASLDDKSRATNMHLEHEPGRINILRWIWPGTWGWRWWKPKDRRRDLVRAGALIIAEIERLDRLAARSATRTKAPHSP